MIKYKSIQIIFLTIDVLCVDGDARIRVNSRHLFGEMAKLPSWTGPPPTKKELNADREMMPVDVPMVLEIFPDRNHFICTASESFFFASQTKNEGEYQTKYSTLK